MRLLVALLASLAVLAAPRPAAAVFHIAVIDEVLTSYDGDATIQFVEIKMNAPIQNQVQDSVLGFFDAAGVYVGDVLIVPANVTNSGNGVRWLMGTAAFETESGIQVDFEFAPGIITGSGMICWGAPGSSTPDPATWDHDDPTQYTDCIAYGGYTGPTNSFIGATPHPLSPDGHSLVRVAEAHVSATDFTCADPATPTSNLPADATLAATVACPAAPLTKGQAKCVDKLHGGANGVAKAVNAVVKSCTGAFAKGRNTSAVDCFGADVPGKVAKPAAKTIAAETKFCADVNAPPYGALGAGVWNEAEADAAFEAFVQLFNTGVGDADDVLVTKATDAAGAKCQATAIAQLARTVDGALKASQRAQKGVYSPKGGGTPPASPEAAALAIDAALANDPKLTKLLFSVGSAVGKSCPASFAALFGERCSDAVSPDALGGCVYEVGTCHVCIAIEESTGLGLDCAALSSAECVSS